jgi:hypothetical protein
MSWNSSRSVLPILVWSACLIGVLAIVLVAPGSGSNGAAAENTIVVVILGGLVNFLGLLWLRRRFRGKRQAIQAGETIHSPATPVSLPSAASVAGVAADDRAVVQDPEAVFFQDIRTMLEVTGDLEGEEVAAIQHGWKILRAVDDRDLPLRFPLAVVISFEPWPASAPCLDFPLIVPQQAFRGLRSGRLPAGETGQPGKLFLTKDGFQVEYSEQHIAVAFDRITFFHVGCDWFTLHSVAPTQELTLRVNNPAAVLLVAQRWYDRQTRNSS